MQQLLKHKGCTEAFPSLTLVWVRGQEVLVTPEANSVITLATKTYKEAPVIKQAKYTGNMSLPPPLASTHTAAAPLHTD
ncbi:hypothetical protein HAX54_045123, partial [Datura stramonium]|nr:hypothetical protein [Datura stramonium]